jgi:hypothetical protein
MREIPSYMARDASESQWMGESRPSSVAVIDARQELAPSISLSLSTVFQLRVVTAHGLAYGLVRGGELGGCGHPLIVPPVLFRHSYVRSDRARCSSGVEGGVPPPLRHSHVCRFAQPPRVTTSPRRGFPREQHQRSHERRHLRRDPVEQWRRS